MLLKGAGVVRYCAAQGGRGGEVLCCSRRQGWLGIVLLKGTGVIRYCAVQGGRGG